MKYFIYEINLLGDKMKKIHRLNVRIDDEDYLAFQKIEKALSVPGEDNSTSNILRIMIWREFVALRKEGLISCGVYE